MSGVYGRYRNVRNGAWKLILDLKIDSLPFDALEACAKLGIGVSPYEKAEGLIDALEMTEVSKSTDGFSVFFEKIWLIFYKSDEVSTAYLNFIVAHELGHILLGHKMNIKNSIQYTNETVKKDEAEADMFAGRVMAPACVLKELDIRTTDEIMMLCRMPYLQAANRAKRMEELYSRDSFYKSDTEKELRLQFQQFIKSRRSG